LRPFLKWAGGKYRIINKIQAQLAPGKRLVEPFVGSGAVFLNTDYPGYLLADSNSDLINLYKVLQSQGTGFIEVCRRLFVPETNNEDTYYRFRTEFNQTKNKKRKAALFLYLNRHGYNGLCRYNSSGELNTPFGRYARPYFPQKEMLFFGEKSQNATFVCWDFKRTMAEVKPGDVVYCDPPYIPLSATSKFTEYSTGGFGVKQQEELAALSSGLAQKGIPVLLSNHDTEFIRKVYHQATITSFEVRRFISCNGDKRNKTGEVLALFAGAG
jgi:DNA adenine methylase